MLFLHYKTHILTITGKGKKDDDWSDEEAKVQEVVKGNKKNKGKGDSDIEETSEALNTLKLEVKAGNDVPQPVKKSKKKGGKGKKDDDWSDEESTPVPTKQTASKKSKAKPAISTFCMLEMDDSHNEDQESEPEEKYESPPNNGKQKKNKDISDNKDDEEFEEEKDAEDEDVKPASQKEKSKKEKKGKETAGKFIDFACILLLKNYIET